jgi:hypothetical protein
MVPVLSLWLPIILAAVFVFIASSIIHMVLPIHRGDLRRLPKEDEVREALRPFAIPPGDYAVPMAGSMAAMKDPAFMAKMREGPVALITVAPNGPPTIGTSLILWFLYSLVVGVFAAYIAGRALHQGADYLEVFRFAGCTAFAGYSLALVQSSIWARRSWVTTAKAMLDGLLYALLTGGTFGWLWPH